MYFWLQSVAALQHYRGIKWHCVERWAGQGDSKDGSAFIFKSPAAQNRTTITQYHTSEDFKAHSNAATNQASYYVACFWETTPGTCTEHCWCFDSISCLRIQAEVETD
jgi:hypothetical protein